jgi:hypothetical protein
MPSLPVRRLVLLTASLAVSVACGTAAADPWRDAAARLAVDVVLLKGSAELRGRVVSHVPEGTTTIAVRREWLQRHAPALFPKLVEREARDRTRALEQLTERIPAWLAQRTEDRELAAIVRRELEAFRHLLAKPPDPSQEQPAEFVLVELTPEQVRRVFLQTPERRQAAMAAWQARLADVERAPCTQLERTLDRQVPDWQAAAVDLSDRLPALGAQDDREWAARQALYEYAFRKRLDFQGTGDFIVRTGAGGQPAVGPDMLRGLLGEGLGADLAGLLGEGAAPKRKTWFETAVQAADQEGIRGCRVTRTTSDLARRQVTVEQAFLARMPDGTWEQIWQHAESLDASQERKDLEERIRTDPQVAQALGLLESLGGAANLETAVRFGAATMAAQQQADDRFFAFKDRYSKRLDGPPLRWGTAEP